MNDLFELSTNTVPNMLLDKLTAQNIILLFDADFVSFEAFAAYCIFRAITALYEKSEPKKALYAHLSAKLKDETGVADIVPNDRYARLKRLFHSAQKGRQDLLSRMGIDFTGKDEFRMETSADRRQGYQLSNHQHEQLSRMYDIGLKDIQDIFKLADSKNISYKEFCTRYNRYTTEWLYTHNLAESPIKQIEAAIDFQSFENSTMLEGLYSLATCVLETDDYADSKEVFLWMAEQIFFATGLFSAAIIPISSLQSTGYLPTDSLSFSPLYTLGRHDVLMRGNILRSTDQEWNDQNLFPKLAALNILSYEMTNLIIEKIHLTLSEVEKGFPEFIQTKYPIWNVITENKVWTKEKVLIIRTLLSDIKAIIGM